MRVWSRRRPPLGRMGLESELVVPALTNCLKHSEPNVRWPAAAALGQFFLEARPAVPALIGALQDPDRRVRETATNALAQIAPEMLKTAEERGTNGGTNSNFEPLNR